MLIPCDFTVDYYYIPRRRRCDAMAVTVNRVGCGLDREPHVRAAKKQSPARASPSSIKHMHFCL